MFHDKPFLSALEGADVATLAPAELATLAARIDLGVTRKPTRLFGMDLENARRGEAADRIVDRALLGLRTTISFVNADCINIAHRDPAYRALLDGSDMLLPDGSGMKLAARMAGVTMGDNLNGTDLFPEICARAAHFGLSIYLLGARPGVADDAADAMAERFPGLRIAGARDGYFDADETDDVIAAINASGADILFVAMGVPLQERWIADHRGALHCPVALGVGGLFDYYSGRIARAPMAFRRVGCEWVWRLAQEPRRLARRYLVGNLAFLAKAWQAAYGITARRIAKRGFDLAAALAGLAVLWPLLALAAIAIRLDSRGPVFFRQSRVGRDGRPFAMWKFRSMVVDAHVMRAVLLEQSDRDAVCFKMRDDPRVTPVGRFLRRWSLDELPQLFNVVRGEMSLVGPRPALPEEAATYRGREWQRLRGKPGITCTWQVSGRAEIPFARQVEMDIEYVSNVGLRRDLALLARTLPAVLASRGAY